MSTVEPSWRRLLTLRVGVPTVLSLATAIWLGWWWYEDQAAEEELVTLAPEITVGASVEDVLRAFLRSPHAYIDFFDDAREIEGEILVVTPSQLGANNSVLHVSLDPSRRVDCVAFRTERSAWERPTKSPADRGCAHSDTRFYRSARVSQAAD